MIGALVGMIVGLHAATLPPPNVALLWLPVDANHVVLIQPPGSGDGGLKRR